jgi:transcriptional regulator GlxA family with amidase domain
MIPHTVCFLVYPGVASYDVSGPAQALRSTGLSNYKVVMASVTGGLVESDCPGVAFGTVAAESVADPIDTLIIPGGNEAPTAANDAVLIRWIRSLAARAGRVACVCTGAFLAAEAGLLNGRRAATHWRFCEDFARRFQHVKVECDPIWIKDGGIYTSAGVSAGVDLALALIEEDQGVEVALQAARELVVFFKRPGGQSQYSNVLSAQISNAGGPIQKVLAWLADHLGSDIRPQLLADKARMSLRTFARYCVEHTGMTPAKLIETLRVQAAREAIETSSNAFETIAIRYGFGDEQRMRRAFVRQVRATPADIRARFSRC